MCKLMFILLFLVNFCCVAQVREIAITLDDLPLVASKMNTAKNRQLATERFMRILKKLAENKVPATGFVIAGAIAKGQMIFLKQFRHAGFMLGNHTYSHYNLNDMDAEHYIADIARADKILASLLTQPKFFRYPYLAEGNQQTKQKVYDYLAANQYIIAPVTIDSQDFRFNEQIYKIPFAERENFIKKLKPYYLDFIWNQTLKAEERAQGLPYKQILLLHANLLNSYLLDDILKMYKRKGYQFISLPEAVKNPAPPIIFFSEIQ